MQCQVSGSWQDTGKVENQLNLNWNVKVETLTSNCQQGSVIQTVSFPLLPPLPQLSHLQREVPSKLRRQKRRQKEAIHEAEKANPLEENVSNQSEKSVDTPPEEAVPIPEEQLVQKPAEKQAKQSLQFKCEHCDYRVSCKAKLTKHINTEYKEDYLNGIHSTPTLIPYQSDQCSFVGVSDKGLKQHTRLSHRISQLDGNISDPEDNTLPEVVKSETTLELLFDSPPPAVNHPVAGVGKYHSKSTYSDDKNTQVKQALCYIFDSGDIIVIDGSLTAKPVGFTPRRSTINI